MKAGSDESDGRLDAGRPRRLPVLWLICVLFGLAGMFNLCLVLLARPLGMVVFGGLALLSFGVAVGLWLRWNPMRIAAVAVLALGSVLLLIGFSQDRLGEGALNIVPVGIYLLIITHLLFRRAHFKVPREQKPRLLSWPGLAAWAIVVFLGMSGILLLTVDDPAREFPGLEVEHRFVPDHENGFVALERLLAEMPAWEDEETRRLLETTGPAEAADPELWYAEATAVVRGWGPWLSGMHEVLARPHFAAPRAATVLDLEERVYGWLALTRELARRLVLVSQVHVHEGRPAEALAAARQTIELGLRICEGSNALITYLAGVGVTAMGLEQTRGVAGSGVASLELLRAEIERLEMDAALTRSVKRALALEFEFTARSFADLKDPRSLARLTEPGKAPAPAWAEKLLRDPMPVVKVNMSRNLLGDLFSSLVVRTERYEPPAAEATTGPFGIEYMTEEMNFLHFLRNPMGDILAVMLAPALNRTVQVHFRAVGDARLTQVFLALRCYHLEHGRLPVSLDGLAPAYFDEVPVDPFAEEPFRYEPAAEPPRVYSVGPDQEPDDEDEDEDERDDQVVELTFAARQSEKH
ncbi:MAG: hypothetical protein KAX19_14125 [Candidatus Brocadiae bacterium]|nr:hypothetical protein [Candidatus Brocadiia bacterium]